MSATISGREVVWGIPSGVKDAVHGVTTSGIVQSVNKSGSIQESEIMDEDSEYCTHVSYGSKGDVTIEVICEPLTVEPEAGDVIGPLTALGITGGQVIVKTANVVFSNAEAKKLSINATHYPEMASGS